MVLNIAGTSSPVKWLIVEDALRDRKGHWAEYIDTFRRGLTELGDEVTILADRHAELFIADRVDTHAVLPDSIWHRMDDRSSRLRRLARIPGHAWSTQRAIGRWWAENPPPDIIFVPTVLTHHLLGWWRIYCSVLKKSRTRLLLFFPNTPVQHDSSAGRSFLSRDPSSRLLSYLITKFGPAVRSGQVILGGETRSMCEAMTDLTGVKFTYFPHPVGASVCDGGDNRSKREAIHFGSYGPARWEKGSHLLQPAIRRFLQRHSDIEVRFSIQWITDFRDSSGEWVRRDPVLLGDSRVRYIDSYFAEGGYAQQLADTDVLVLPYLEPYRFRVSRVVIEAMISGIPAVVTRQTTLWEQVRQYGAGIPCEMADVQSLADSLSECSSRFSELRNAARQKLMPAAEHFSVRQFASYLNQ